MPVRWFDTESFFIEFRKMLGEKVKSSNEIYKFLAYNRIMMLDRMLIMISLLMQNQNERSLFGLIFKRKIKNYKGNLDFYIEKVNQITGIKIKDGNDLKRLKSEVQRLIDKYTERFGEREKVEHNKIDFMDIVLGVFSIMEMAYIPEMKMAEFGRLKVLADKRVKQMNKK